MFERLLGRRRAQATVDLEAPVSVVKLSDNRVLKLELLVETEQIAARIVVPKGDEHKLVEKIQDVIVWIENGKEDA